MIAEELQYAWLEALDGPSLWSLCTLMGPWEFGRRESVKLERMTGTSGSAASNGSAAAMAPRHELEDLLGSNDPQLAPAAPQLRAGSTSGEPVGSVGPRWLG